MLCGEGLCSVLSADFLHNILFCCVKWELVRVQDVVSAYMFLQIYLQEALDKKRSFLTCLRHAAVRGLVYLNHAYERVGASPRIGLCSSLQVLVGSTVGRRGALLGLYMMIDQDAYNLPSAIGLICSL